MTEKNPWWRPPKRTKAEDMQKAIDAYFARTFIDAETEEEKKWKTTPTVTWLALACGFDCRQSLLNYWEKEEFFDTVKKAKWKIEEWVEKQLFNKWVPTVGAIFNLKNNYNRKDKTETEITTGETGKIAISVEEKSKIDDLLSASVWATQKK